MTSEFDSNGSVEGYLSCIIAILYFATIYTLEKLGSSVLWTPWFRGLLADYAYPVSTSLRGGGFPVFGHFKLNPENPAFVKCYLADNLSAQLGTIFWVGFAHIPGTLRDANISTVPITKAFYPTQPRNWLIDFWTLEVKWIFAAIPFGFLVMLLFYYDHVCFKIWAQIDSVLTGRVRM